MDEREKYEASPKKSVKTEQPDKENVVKMSRNFGALNNPASFGYPGYPFFQGPMPMPPFFGASSPSNFQGSFGNGRFNSRGRGGYSRRGNCLFVKKAGTTLLNALRLRRTLNKTFCLIFSIL